MTQPVWEQETIPLPRLSGWLLEHFLSTHQLSLREVARAAQMPLLVVWRVCRGLPIAAWQAARLTEAERVQARFDPTEGCEVFLLK
jgi:hypothetical protein